MAHADPAPPPPPPGPKTSFGDGTFTVGTDIVPGVYQSAGPVEGGVCYWKRSNGKGAGRQRDDQEAADRADRGGRHLVQVQ